jgi:hypothetical protein
VGYIHLTENRYRPTQWCSDQSSCYSSRHPVRFPALPYFLKSTGSGTGSTQPRENKRGATWKKWWRLRSRKPRIRPYKFITTKTWHPLLAKIGTNLAYKGRSLGTIRSRTQAMEFRIYFRGYGPVLESCDKGNNFRIP